MNLPIPENYVSFTDIKNIIKNKKNLPIRFYFLSKSSIDSSVYKSEYLFVKISCIEPYDDKNVNGIFKLWVQFNNRKCEGYGKPERLTFFRIDQNGYIINYNKKIIGFIFYTEADMEEYYDLLKKIGFLDV